MAEEAREKLQALGFSAALVNPRWIKPMDTACLERFARKVGVICTFEDHVLHNGFGCGVIEYLNDAGIRTPVVRIGWPDEFVEHGKPDILREKHGITAQAAVDKVMPFLETRRAVGVA